MAAVVAGGVGVNRIDWPTGLGFLLVAVIVSACLVFTANAPGHACAKHSKKCAKRAKIDRFLNMPYCHTWACVARNPWRLRWVDTPEQWRRWTLITEACESGHDPLAVNTSGSGAGGSMQFMPGTWAAAGGRGSVFSASIFEQRVRAWRFAARHGRSHWVCSPW